MFGGIDPKKMNLMMKQMGISQKEIPANKVIIEKIDNSKIIIKNPVVTKINMKGHESFQIIGEVLEESSELTISKEDIKILMEKTGCSEEQAIKSLKKTGDLAESILELNNNK